MSADELATSPLRVFISYRNSDAAGHAGRLYDALTRHFASGRVFMDIDAIPFGGDIRQVIRDAVDTCDAFLALIGNGWLEASDRNGRRRIDAPDDYVRLELEAALSRDVCFLPVLLQDAVMPSADDLPESLSALPGRNAMHLSDRRWKSDVELLCETLEAATRKRTDTLDVAVDGLAHAAIFRDVRKLVSAVFADLAERHPSAEGADPEAVDYAQRRYLDGARAAIERHGGVMERVMGEAVVGIFGVPAAHEDDALRATRAASDLLESARDFSAPSVDSAGRRLDLRIAVATGEAIVRAGSSDSPAGDIAAHAARLQRDAPANTVVLSAATYQLVQAEVDAQPLDARSTRRGHEGDRVFRLDRVRSVEESGVRPATARLIGRDRELTAIARLLDDCVADRSCILLTLLGDAGIGKTRVVTELAGHLGSSARVVVGRCASYGEGLAFLPVAQIVTTLAGVVRGDEPPAVRAKLDELADRFALPPVAAVGLARLVGIEPPAGEIEETFWAFRSVLEGFAQDKPLVVVFEDLHWADDAVFQLIEHVSDWSTGAPILLVATARPDLLDRRPDWAGGRRQATTTTLKPLGHDSASQLLDSLPQGGTLPPAVRSQLLETAGGVPFYLEEVLNALVQQRTTLGADGSRFTADVVLPSSLTALLEARIEQLPDTERLVLQQASVVGDSVTIASLSALAGLPIDDVIAIASEAIRRDIFQVVEGDARRPVSVRWRHALLREVAYQSLTKNQRATLHEAFVDWLDGQPPENPAEREALVARQLERAVTSSRQIGRSISARWTERATTALVAIVDDANGRGRAPSELLMRIRALAEPDEGMRAGLGPMLASAMADNGDCEGAAQLIAEWSTPDPDSVKWQLATAAFLTARLSTGDYEAATAILDRLAAAIPPLEPADEIEALIHRGFLSTQFGQRARAVADFARAARLARDVALTHYELRALRSMITSATYGPTPVDEVERIVADASARMNELGSRPAEIVRVTALLAAMRGEDEVARSSLRGYFELEQTYGLSRYLADQGQDVYDIEWWAGDLDTARRALEQSDKQLSVIDASNYRSTILAQLARVLARQGHAEESVSAAAEAERLVEPYDSDSQVLLHSAYAVAYARLGRFAESFAAADAAVAVNTDCLLDRGEAWLSYAEAFGRAGRIEDARTGLREAVSCFEQKGAESPLRRALRALEHLESSGAWFLN